MPIILLILMPIDDDDDDGVKHQPNIQGVKDSWPCCKWLWHQSSPRCHAHCMLLLRIAKPNYWSPCKQYFYLFKFYNYLKNSKNGKFK
jgi:hypothetical protein